VPRRLRTPRIFTYDEALATFPVVRDLTAEAVRQVEAIASELAGGETGERSKEELEAAYQQLVDQWSREVESLGCLVKGLWLVDWDSGDGYYCWRHPEPSLAHFHGYEEGFAGRVPIN